MRDMAPAIILTVLLALGSVPAPGGHIVAEWNPGITEAAAGGPLVVDGYGVNGLGLYRLALDDGTSVLAVCTQADVGHSTAATYVAEPAVALPAELAYLAWAYLGGDGPSPVVAAAINVLAWRYTDAQRRTGGPVWQGDDIEIRALGVGRLTDVEQAVAALDAEAVARRGPWALTDAGVSAGRATVGLTGPGGPIAGVAVQFRGRGGWAASALTQADGSATVDLLPDVIDVAATATGPGAAIALVAPRSQRLATPGPAVIVATAVAVPPTSTTSTTEATTSTTEVTTTTSTTTTSTTTATTTAPPTTAPPTTLPPPPETSTSTTVAPPTTIEVTSTTSTTSTTPTTSVPPTSTSAPPAPPAAPPPPTIPRTGAGSRRVTRLGAALFAAGSVAVLVATPGRRRSPRRRVTRP